MTSEPLGLSRPSPSPPPFPRTLMLTHTRTPSSASAQRLRLARLAHEPDVRLARDPLGRRGRLCHLSVSLLSLPLARARPSLATLGSPRLWPPPPPARALAPPPPLSRDGRQCPARHLALAPPDARRDLRPQPPGGGSHGGRLWRPRQHGRRRRPLARQQRHLAAQHHVPGPEPHHRALPRHLVRLRPAGADARLRARCLRPYTPLSPSPLS